jgi:uncharacterized protein
MICYIDTSALVPLCVKEASSDDLFRWYANCPWELVSSCWCVTELASALGIKQRTGQITSDAANAAWLRFERMCHNDLKLLPIDPSTFHKAALMALDATSGLRAGDALHLAVALEAKVKQILTLDTVFERNAKAMKLITVEL